MLERCLISNVKLKAIWWENQMQGKKWSIKL